MWLFKNHQGKPWWWSRREERHFISAVRQWTQTNECVYRPSTSVRQEESEVNVLWYDHRRPQWWNDRKDSEVRGEAPRHPVLVRVSVQVLLNPSTVQPTHVGRLSRRLGSLPYHVVIVDVIIELKRDTSTIRAPRPAGATGVAILSWQWIAWMLTDNYPWLCGGDAGLVDFLKTQGKKSLKK